MPTDVGPEDSPTQNLIHAGLPKGHDLLSSKPPGARPPPPLPDGRFRHQVRCVRALKARGANGTGLDGRTVRRRRRPRRFRGQIRRPPRCAGVSYLHCECYDSPVLPPAAFRSRVAEETMRKRRARFHRMMSPSLSSSESTDSVPDRTPGKGALVSRRKRDAAKEAEGGRPSMLSGERRPAGGSSGPAGMVRRT
jgi:hypothetical protein